MSATNSIAVQVRDLRKIYRVERRRPGRFGWLRSLLKPRYEEIRGVDGVSFDIKRGEVVGLIGPNGAGKSTTVKMLTGVLFPTDGDISVFGRNPFHQRIANAQDIGVIFGQRSHLLFDLPPIDSYVLLRHVYGMSANDFEEQTATLTELLGLQDLLRQPVRTLSLGQRMRCELGAAFLHRPRLVYLDEPTIGLDIEAKHRIRDFLRMISRSQGTTVLLTTHDLVDIQQLCERVMVLNHGALIYDGPLQGLIERHASVRSIEAEIEAPTAAALEQPLAARWPEALVTVDGPRLHVSGIASAEEIVEASRLIMAQAGVHNITVREPPIEDVILSVYRHGVRSG